MMKKYCLMALTAMIFLYCGYAQASDLMITEVFFDGTDEWIEITNMSNKDMSGSVEVLGVKSTNILLDLVIASGQSIIIGDQGSHITRTVFGYREKGLSIADTKSINITLSYEGGVQDSLSIDTGLVEALNDTKSSFQREGSGNIVACTAQYSTGVDTGYCASPGLVLPSREDSVSPPSNGSGSDGGTGNDAGTGDLITGAVDTGAQDPIQTGLQGSGEVSAPSRQLMISEVFVDGTDERIEITNRGTGSFSGILTLEGVKSSPLVVHLHISGGQSKIIADKTDFFDDKTSVTVSGAGLSMLDSKELYVRMLYEQRILDTFYVSEEDVQRFDNQKTSFEKAFYDGVLLMTYTTEERTSNVMSGYYASPGIMHILSMMPEILIGGDMIRDCPSNTESILISELSKGMHGLPPFIELYASGNEEMLLVLSGSLLTSPLSIVIPATSPGEQRWFVVSNTGAFAQGTKVLSGDIQLLSGGQLLVYGQSGQLLDNMYVEELSSNVSYYPQGARQSCIQYMQAKDQPTPGLSHEVLSYFLFNTNEQEQGSVGGCAARPEFIDISIRGIVADPEGKDSEKILLRLDRGAETLNLEGYYLMIGSRKRYLKGQLSEGVTQSIEQNFAFPDSRAECVTLYDKSDQALDDICYSKETAAGFYRDMSMMTELDNSGTDEQEPNVTIVEIVYDPPGNDMNNESIKLQNNNNMSYDSKELWLQVGDKNTKTYLYGGLRSNEEKIFIGNYRLPNTKASCVSLMHGTTLLDTYCYDPNQDQKTNRKEQEKERDYRKNDLTKVEIELTGVVYDPEGNDASRESITFVLKKGRKIDLSDFYLLIGKRKRTLEGILTDDKPLTITKTWGLANNAIGCITLMHQEKAYAHYCYNPHENKLTEKTPPDWNIVIHDIEYDPPGRDENAESITIKNSGEEAIDMSTIQIAVNKKKFVLSGTIAVGKQKTWTGTFHFPNAGACISVMYGNHLYDSWCYGNRSKKKIAMIQKARIASLQYDPPGSDLGYESISLEFEGRGSIDLGQEAYLMVNDRKKSLHGLLSPGTETTFAGNFAFPNTKGCVDLVIHDQIYDSYCYDTENKKKSSGIRIVKLLADPQGRDDGNELIRIYGGKDDMLSDVEVYSNGKHKTVGREVLGNGLFQAKGALGLTNTFGCVSLYQNDDIQDQRCYYNPREGERLTPESNSISIDPRIASTINTIALVETKDSYCLSLQGQHFSCKEKEQRRTSVGGESFYKSYIASLHSYLYHNRPSLYFKSDIGRYKEWYDLAIEQLHSGSKTIAIGGKEYKSNNFENIVEDQRIDSYIERAVKSVERIQYQSTNQTSL